MTFKVYLRKGCGGSVVRMFMVNQEDATSKCFIKKKVARDFPSISKIKFSLSWTDSDGDDIAINSDAELQLALCQMSGPVYKLNVTDQGTPYPAH